MARFDKNAGIGRPTGLPGPKGAGVGAVQNNGSALTGRQTINFAGSPLKAVDNAGASRTDVSVIKEGPLNVAWPEYGAVVDGSTDDTAAWQAAINAIPQGAATKGGTILHPGGKSICASPLVANGKIGVTIQSWSHQGGYNNVPAGSIVFTGAAGTGANGAMIDARSSTNFRLRGLSVRYTSGSYTGHLIDFSHDVSAIDAGGMLIEGCHLGGDYTAQVKGAAALVLLDKAILGTIRNSYLQFAARGVRGNQTGYSNSFTFDDVTVDNFTVAAFTDANEGWTFINPKIEGTQGLSGSALRRFYYQENTATGFNGMTIIGGWCGDLVNASFVAIDCPATAQVCGGLTLLGGLWNGVSGQPAVNLAAGCPGLLIAGAKIGGTGIALPAASPGATGAIVGNQFLGTAGTTNTTGVNPNVACLGNTGSNAPNTLPTNLQLVSTASIVGAGTAATVTVGTSAGTGATASVNSNGITGTITLNTGTGPGTGQQVKLNYGTAFGSGITDFAPKVFLTPANAAAGANAPGFWHDTSNGGTGFGEIKNANAIAASTTYIWRYLIVQ